MNEQQAAPLPSLPPLPPLPPLLLPQPHNLAMQTPAISSIRSSYMNLFSQILDNSIKINCICKTTTKITNVTPIPNQYAASHNDFMNDDDDDEYDDSNSNDVEMKSFATENENELNLNRVIDRTSQNSNTNGLYNYQHNKICDLSCFENMRYIHNTLKNCFKNISNKVEEEDNQKSLDKEINEFEVKWNSFTFLKNDPCSCDYYGTTIFHYAASDNNYELLRCLIGKYSQGVYCLDSKGMTPLMRASQRNNYKCVEFLLNETNSQINGSTHSAYTPLW
jgi:hypothetical protein